MRPGYEILFCGLSSATITMDEFTSSPLACGNVGLRGESEVHLDQGFDFDWLPIEKVGLVLPFFYRLERSVGELRIS